MKYRRAQLRQSKTLADQYSRQKNFGGLIDLPALIVKPLKIYLLYVLLECFSESVCFIFVLNIV